MSPSLRGSFVFLTSGVILQDFCCIKLGTCVISLQDIVMYQVLSISSCIEVGCMYYDLVLYQYWNLVLYQDRSHVLFHDYKLVLYEVWTCVVSNDSHRWYPMRWISLTGDGLMLYQDWSLVLYQYWWILLYRVMRFYHVMYC